MAIFRETKGVKFYTLHMTHLRRFREPRVARRLRLEYEGACYHVLNRGNYRSDILADEATKFSFLECLDAAATKPVWIVHAWRRQGSVIKSQFLSSPIKLTPTYAIPANEPNKPNKP